MFNYTLSQLITAALILKYISFLIQWPLEK